MRSRVNKTLKTCLAMLLLTACFYINSAGLQAAAKYNTWQEVASAMQDVLNEAKDLYVVDKEAAADKINEAYFSYYENLGFEKNAANFVGGKRKILNENAKRNARRIAKAGGEYADFAKAVDTWIHLLQVDAKVLDGLAASVEEAEVLVQAANSNAAAAGSNFADVNAGTANDKSWSKFVVAYGLTLREGVEAILVIVAILAYLAKSEQKQLNNAVYGGMFAGVAVSILLAVIFNLLRQALGDSGVGQGQEVFEGVTMLLAVVVLFFVSNWLLAKSDITAWQAMLHKQVASAVGKGSILALVFSSFLAVAREGAELILFFQVLLTGNLSEDYGVWLGLAAGMVSLGVIWVLFRIYAVKLPLKPFFYFTSILMFVLCFSFAGKGVMELIEGNVIVANNIAFMDNFTVDLLGIYPYYETLLPQLFILLITVLLFIKHFMRQKRKLHAMELVKPGSSTLLKIQELKDLEERKLRECLLLQAREINAYLEAYQAAKVAGNLALQQEYKEALLIFPQAAIELSQTLKAKVKLDVVDW